MNNGNELNNGNFKYIFLNWIHQRYIELLEFFAAIVKRFSNAFNWVKLSCYILSLKFVLKGPVDNISALGLVMAWCPTNTWTNDGIIHGGRNVSCILNKFSLLHLWLCLDMINTHKQQVIIISFGVLPLCFHLINSISRQHHIWDNCKQWLKIRITYIRCGDSLAYLLSIHVIQVRNYLH